jgi:NAD(P)-dependent dehydrogenase (short-subunit alcohol dehydrogenase family)
MGGVLAGKAAVVTGGARGIGRAIVMRLAADGASVVFSFASNQQAADDVVAAGQGRVHAVRADQGDPADQRRLFEVAQERLGGLDILVNNAAISPPTPILAVTPEDYDRVMNVNARGPFFAIQHAGRVLRDGGRIINISSVSTRVASAHGIGYPMTKGALDVFSHTLAKHLGPRGITVNAVAVGFTHTDMTADVLADPANVARNIGLTALGRIGRVPDIADAVAFLASDDARWITGTKIDVAGGVNL